MAGHGWTINFEGTDLLEPLEAALRAVARAQGVVDVTTDRPGGQAGASYVVVGVVDGRVQLWPWSEQLGAGDPTQRLVVVDLTAITELTIY